MSQTHSVVIFSKVGSLVDHSSTSIRCHIGVCHHSEGSLSRLVTLHVLEIWEQWSVGQTLETVSLHLLQDGVVLRLLEQLHQSGLHHDVDLVCLVVLHLAVLQLRVDTQRQVAKHRQYIPSNIYLRSWSLDVTLEESKGLWSKPPS